MGWCNGTEIFDVVCAGLLEDPPASKEEILKDLIEVLEDEDWDCQNESAYFEHPLVQAAFKDLHPNWFEDNE